MQGHLLTVTPDHMMAYDHTIRYFSNTGRHNLTRRRQQLPVTSRDASLPQRRSARVGRRTVQYKYIDYNSVYVFTGKFDGAEFCPPTSLGVQVPIKVDPYLGVLGRCT